MLKPIDWNKVAEHVQNGYINVQKHPELDLWLYNYTNTVQYDFFWNNETLQCRGLIVDKDKNYVNLVPQKFFTLDQLESIKSHLFASHILRKIAANEPFSVQDKADGSFISICKYNNQLIVATRGSFNSDQAIKAREILATKYRGFILPDNLALCCEVIFPANRIVINYGAIEDLYLFAAFDIKTGNELDIYSLDLPFPKVDKYDYQDFFELLRLQPENKEGFVVRFNDGSRVKIKTDDYKLKHKLFTNLNERTIWEYLAEEKSFNDILEIADDVFYDFIHKTANLLQSEFEDIKSIAMLDYNLILDTVPDNLILREGRKAFAELALKTPYPQLLFNLLDNKPLNTLIWKMLEPKFPKKPFTESLYEEI